MNNNYSLIFRSLLSYLNKWNEPLNAILLLLRKGLRRWVAWGHAYVIHIHENITAFSPSFLRYLHSICTLFTCPNRWFLSVHEENQPWICVVELAVQCVSYSCIIAALSHIWNRILMQNVPFCVITLHTFLCSWLISQIRTKAENKMQCFSEPTLKNSFPASSSSSSSSSPSSLLSPWYKGKIFWHTSIGCHIQSYLWTPTVQRHSSLLSCLTLI